MPRRSASAVGAWILATYIVVALIQSWPLPLHLSTGLTGTPGGDTGVYVWNTWVFKHELLERHRSPFSTETILQPDGPADLSLHNYTVFADLLAIPLQPLVGVVAAFNLVYLINVVLAACGMFLLARDFQRDEPAGTSEAWLAGLLFACSPFLVARSTAHFSLAAAAPLPFFVWFLDRTWRHGRTRDAIGTGVSVAWAAFSDPYYAIYCLMLGVFFVGSHLVAIHTNSTAGRNRALRFGLDLTIATLACLVIGVRLLTDDVLQIGALTVSMRSLYTPVLLLTTLVVVRMLVTLRPGLTWTVPAGLRRQVGAGVLAVGVTVLLIAPELYAIALRAMEGRMVPPPVLWRSSAPGVDLVSFFLPNPNHPFTPQAVVDWVSHQPNRYEENVASLPWVALLVIVAAWRSSGWRPHRLWITMALAFGILALGPFLQIAGVQTFVPTPWALLRYVPLIGEARMPPRFGVVVIMAVAMLFASGLTSLLRAYPARRRMLLVIVGMALSFELLPAPRTLYSAEIPPVYRTIAADPRPVRVIDLPFGVRDGLSSIGDFSASSQLFQTLHGKALIGGYLSRVSDASKELARVDPVLRALVELSARRPLTDTQRSEALAAAPSFIDRAHLGYVVMDDARVSPALRTFAIELLGLKAVEQTGAFALYAPQARP